ncbi:MAG: EAL domain-containing protein, partial [Bradyrhizobium sp.]|uniref:EAL domain-containing protein n=1 Tax=Bradyrhizobium sp. TaxID=376 RepID=UPI003D10A1F7
GNARPRHGRGGLSRHRRKRKPRTHHSTPRSPIGHFFNSLLERLKELGVKLAVDDFGTGYSSLAYLSRFPFDRIKIDRSFVQEMLSGRGGASIIRATAEMALDLGLKTTAEGIETPTQLFELRKLRIEHGQGFLFTRPLSAANLAAFLASNFSRKSIVTDTDISSVPASKSRLFA